MVRTIEQILGAQPLNQKLAAATPMYGAFTGKANNKPFNAVPNQVPLTEGVVTPPSCGVDTLGTTGAKLRALKRTEARRNAVPADEKATAVAWQATTLAIAAMAIGVPVGIAAGRWAWIVFARGLGIVPAPEVPILFLLLLVPGTVIVANLVALVPGELAARLRPGRALRAE
jgi:hypothetical protein